MSGIPVFCPHCGGIFQSRAFNADLKLSGDFFIDDSREQCIFCGKAAILTTDLDALKSSVLSFISSQWASLENLKEARIILEAAASNQITTEDAAVKLEDVSKGMGQTFLGFVNKHGRGMIPHLLAAVGLFIAWQGVQVGVESNRIAQEQLVLARQQVTEQALSTEHPPPDSINKKKVVKGRVRETGPHHPMAKNRKMRRAEKAKKQRPKGRPF